MDFDTPCNYIDVFDYPASHVTTLDCTKFISDVHLPYILYILLVTIQGGVPLTTTIPIHLDYMSKAWKYVTKSSTMPDSKHAI